MKILINSSNLRFGGGKTVAINIIRQLVKDNNYEIILISPLDSHYDEFEKHQRIELVRVPEKYNKDIYKPFLNSKYLVDRVRFYKPDIVFSLGNIAIPVDTFQILLIQQAFLVYPESIVWKRLKLLNNLYAKMINWQIFRNLRKSNLILVQTEVMRTRLSRITNISKDEIKILPNAVNFANSRKNDIHSDKNKSDLISLLFLSKYYPHKNFEVLLEVAEIIKVKKINISISVTLDKQESADTALFLEEVGKLGYGGIINNLGNLDLHEIESEYKRHDGLFLPTLLESFSGTYVEAMYYGRPVFTSNLDFAIGICGDAAFYFDPLSAENIVETITSAFSNLEVIEQKIKKGKKYCEQLKDWDEIGADLKHLLSKIELTHLRKSS